MSAAAHLVDPKWEELYRALYAPPMTADDLALFERLKKLEMDRAEKRRGIEAKYRDCLEFALAHGLSGTPKYQTEALRCLEVAAELIRGGSGH